MKLQLYRNNLLYIFNSDTFRSGTYDFPVYLVGTLNWGIAPSHQLTQRGPFQMGDTYVGYRDDPRVFSLPIVVPASSAEDAFTKRAALARVFRHGDDELTLRISWASGATSYERSIDGRVVGGMQMDTDPKTHVIRTVVQIKANDPTWYSTYQTVTPISSQLAGTPTSYPKVYGNVADGGAVVGVTYGDSVIDKITTITYGGTADSYPTIQAVGPLTNLTISDTLGHIINFPGTIAAGSTYTIDLSYGVYTVRDQNGVNRFSELSANTDLVQWRIYTESDAVSGGINTISVSATGTTAASTVTLYYNERYIGV